MIIYNTLTRKKEEFIPINNKKVQMFVCGPTVYDYIHAGNARTFVIFDVVAKYLRSEGCEVFYLQNITDIDDKIIDRAKEKGVVPAKLAKEFSDIFIEDIKNLGITGVTEYASATKFIPEIINQVKRLINKSFAYKIDDGWYFDLAKFPEYGKLSGRTAEMAEDAVSRIDESAGKRNRGDFCLWKFSPPAGGEGEPSWPTDIGDGRPGWHIEDTAITEKYFGPQYDLHGAGQDLMFPHHEAEIAQQEAASGKKPFVKYWMHAGFLVNKEAKMSKSAGNFATARELLERYPVHVLRLYFLSSHYRSSLDYSETLINQAVTAITRIADFVFRLKYTEGTHSKEADQTIQEAQDNFHSSMDDDFNTPQAIAAIFTLIRKLNPLMNKGEFSKDQADKTMDFLITVRQILGIVPEAEEYTLPTEIEMLMEQRNKYREQNDWEKADAVRYKIESKGYKIDDTPYGPIVSKK